MPTPVVAGGQFECTNSGQGMFTGGSSRLTVGGANVIVFGQEKDQTFLVPCTATTPPPASSPSPCMTTKAALSGESSKLTVGGTGVLLESASGPTDNVVVSTWKITKAGQSKLTVSS